MFKPVQTGSHSTVFVQYCDRGLLGFDVLDAVGQVVGVAAARWRAAAVLGVPGVLHLHVDRLSMTFVDVDIDVNDVVVVAAGHQRRRSSSFIRLV